MVCPEIFVLQGVAASAGAGAATASREVSNAHRRMSRRTDDLGRTVMARSFPNVRR
jgi:hypothetical protein